MRLWVNSTDIRPSSHYLSRWLDHLDGSIAHRIHSRVFDRDWKWLVMVPGSQSSIKESLAGRQAPVLSSFWLSSAEIERQYRRSSPFLPPALSRSRVNISFWEKMYNGMLDASLRCKEFALSPVSSPPPERDFFPYTILPDDPLWFTHALALRVGLLTARELQQVLKTVGKNMETCKLSLSPETIRQWQAGVAALGLIMQHWPEHWNWWQGEHVSLQRSVLRSQIPAQTHVLPMDSRNSSEDFRPPAALFQGGFPAECRLFVNVVSHYLAAGRSVRDNGTGREAAGSPRQLRGPATGTAVISGASTPIGSLPESVPAVVENNHPSPPPSPTAPAGGHRLRQLSLF